MEGFLEANRVVEASLTKLGRVSKNSELSLRKTLLVSKTLMKAQDTAETVQDSLMPTESATLRGSSKLLATMKSTVAFEEDSVVSNLEIHNRSSQKLKHQSVSPIVLSSNQSTSENKDEDVMEFISHSVISDLFSEDEMDCCANKPVSPWTRDTPNVSHWSPMVQITADVREVSPPLSPIKRQHNVAFPTLEDGPFPSSGSEESKRFKFSSYDYAESLPGFCDHLSPKNLCSAPLITYMFGKGFGVPSNPTELDWPGSHAREESLNAELCSLSPSKLFPVLAY